MSDLDVKTTGTQNIPQAIGDLEHALQNGYGAAHLYQRLAVYHLMRSEKLPALKYLNKAIVAPLDLTQSRELIKTLTNPNPIPGSP
jgi:hypothetical protein